MLFSSYSISGAYWTSAILSPAFSIGFCIGIFVALQVITGFLLAMHYVAYDDVVFFLIHADIIRDYDFG